MTKALIGCILAGAPAYGITFSDGGNHVYTATGGEDVTIENGTSVQLDGTGRHITVVDGSATVTGGTFFSLSLYTGTTGTVTGGDFVVPGPVYSGAIIAYAGSTLSVSGGSAEFTYLYASLAFLPGSGFAVTPGYTIDASFSGGSIGILNSIDSSTSRGGIADIAISGTADIDWLSHTAPGLCEISDGFIRKLQTWGTDSHCRLLGASFTQEAEIGVDSILTVRGYNLDYTPPNVSGEYETLGTFSFPITTLHGTLILDEIPVAPSLFAEHAILWAQPLARPGMSTDTDPTAEGTLKYRFKMGKTIPIKIYAEGLEGDVTTNSNVTATVVVYGDADTDGFADGNALPIDYNGLGGAGGVMDKIDGRLVYNLDTETLRAIPDTNCYLLEVTVTDSSTGESAAEMIPLQAQ